MNIINFNQEWGFIITETHKEKPCKKNLVKREVLFNLQILLNKIEKIGKANKINFLRRNYFLLKKIYCAKKS